LKPYPIGAAGLDALAFTRQLSHWLEWFLGPPKSLDESARGKMEAFFGRSLADVRLYDSLLAVEMATRLGADAFTFGNRIFAPATKLNPQTKEGLGLLAHELTHVVQQTQPQRLQYAHELQKPQANWGQGMAQVREQPAMYSPPDLNPALSDIEGEAQANEQMVRAQKSTQTTSEIPPPEIEIVALANKVYRLMQQELVLERERVVSTR
jgi:hypothetical protein